MDTSTILLGANTHSKQVHLYSRMANRHGLIAGATGTGKTVTLQVLAEHFSNIGVPVFTADVKGDLSGLSAAGKPHPKIQERIDKIKIKDHSLEASPTVFWDVFGISGHPIRTTITEMGPVLLSNLLELNETQEGIMHIAFSIADDEGLLLLDIKDLRALLNWMADNSKEIKSNYGNVSSSSVGAIQRRLHVLNESGGDVFFGEPALDIRDLLRTDLSGRGVINILDGKKLMLNPRIYATFLLWLLSELFEELDEVGDPEKPRLVFFFDEAHLLFDGAPKALLQRIEQVVRLIRSKGVGIYFVTQNPADIPDDVLGQLGNRIQHALRAYTPKDQKGIKAAADSFRPNPAIDIKRAITEMGIGEALISVLDEKGKPTPVEMTLICPPRSRIGPLTADEKKVCIQRSPVAGKYDVGVDRESAYELLIKREAELEKREANEVQLETKETKQRKSGGSKRQGVGEAFLKSMLRAVGSTLGRKIMRGVLGSIMGGR